MSRNIIAVVFSDLHIDDPTKFNNHGQRTFSTLRVLSFIKKKCIRYKCPAIFTGDLFHKSECISNRLLEIVAKYFKRLDEDPWTMYAIQGNHDSFETSTIERRSVNWVETLSEFFNFIAPVGLTNGIGYVKGEPAFKVFGVPYLDHNIGLKEAINSVNLDHNLPNILLLHSNYPGAKDTDGSEITGEVENLNINMLSKFDLVLMGHIHKPQRLSKKVYMVGAPIQQRRTDRDCKLGYWLLYSDMTMKFKELKGWPKFIDVESEEGIKDDGNYYTVVSKKKETGDIRTNNITRGISKKSMVRKYMRAKGIKDTEKKATLIKVLEEVE